MEFVCTALLVLVACRLAWRLAPATACATALTLLTLVGSGAIDPNRLPLAGQVSEAAAAVKQWQATQAHKGACHIRGTAALRSGDEAALEAVETDCRTQ
jgi:hypothetical protein